MSNQAAAVVSGREDLACCPAVSPRSPGEQPAADLAGVFKALGDPVRLRLLAMIAAGGAGGSGAEVCVCELTPAFDVSQPTISHHLKLLRRAGLITGERRGTWVYYRPVPETIDRAAALLADLARTPTGTAATGTGRR